MAKFHLGKTRPVVAIFIAATGRKLSERYANKRNPEEGI